jgi:hypothetical protein
MVGAMMPRGSKKLGLSRMNMLGMGPKMIRWVMKNKNVQSLEELLKAAMENGVRIVACRMSMDIMGIRQEELIDGVELAGVATFLGSAEHRTPICSSERTRHACAAKPGPLPGRRFFSFFRSHSVIPESV